MCVKDIDEYLSTAASVACFASLSLSLSLSFICDDARLHFDISELTVVLLLMEIWQR